MPPTATTGTTAMLTGLAALICYAASAALYLAYLKGPRWRVGWGASSLAAAGVVFNFVALYARSAALHSVPYRDLVGSMSLLGLFLAVMSLLLEVRHRNRSLGPFLMPVVLGFLLVAFLSPPPAHPPAAELKGSVFALHVTLNMLGYAAYAVSCALSVAYLVVGRSLKSRQLSLDGTPSRLPSLSYLVRATRTSLGVGVLASTVAFGLGGYWASRVWSAKNPLWLLDPKILSVALILVFYWVVLVRAHRGAAPVVTARFAVIGFALVLVCYTAINLLFSRLHVFT
jgi:ABC-type transport system involved in cytochrome c biogenesis permease subunit